MFIYEYGDKNNPLVLLFTPMMVSGEELYQPMHSKEYAEEIEAFIRRRQNVLG